MMQKINNSIITSIAYELNVNPAAIYALAKVESSGTFSKADGKIPILLERHWIYKLSKKKFGYKKAQWFNQRYPNLCNPRAGAYGKYSEQYGRLAYASKVIDEEIAHLATSFGAFQIMGFHHNLCGFPTAKAMSDAYHKNPQEEQIKGFIMFLQGYQKGRVLDAVRSEEWKEVARRYNGRNYAKNNYDKKLLMAFMEWEV